MTDLSSNNLHDLDITSIAIFRMRKFVHCWCLVWSSNNLPSDGSELNPGLKQSTRRFLCSFTLIIVCIRLVVACAV